MSIKNRDPINMAQLHPNAKVSNKKIDAMIRVNQAGEYGALRIYAGQLAGLKNENLKPIITHMAQQEQHHLNTFNDMIKQRGIGITLFTPLWHIGGYALGYLSAKLSEKHAMACTVAVEEVIDQHYQVQINELSDNPDCNNLRDNLIQFRQEELEHRDIGLNHTIEPFKGQWIFLKVIKMITKTAIEISKRI